MRKIFSFILATSKQLPATMTSVRPRENTFKVDLSVFPKRPSFEEIHSFVHDVMGLRIDQVKRLQMNHVQNAAHVKCDTLKTAQDAVEEHDGRHEIELNKVKYKVRLQMDDSTVEVKVHDLSENVRDEELIGFLRHYGDVHCIKELVWGENFAYKGISSGIRVVRMTLRKHIQSFVTVQQEKTLVTYRGQPQTCRHCSRLSHPGITCTDNKKLVGQKSDLSDRLKAAQSTDSTSYATVVDKGTAIINSLLPNFVATNLNQLNQAASESKQKELDTTAQQPSCSHLSTATDGVEQSSSSTITPAVAEDDSMSDETIVPVANETELMDQDLQQRGYDDSAQFDATSPVDVSGSPFKSPPLPLPIKQVHSSVSESDESSAERSEFQKVKPRRGRGRPKKPRTDSV